jgi:hypothetical protein
MKKKIIPIALLMTLLLSCGPKLRFDFDWKQYANYDIEDKVTLSAGMDDTWSALIKSGEDLNMQVHVKDKSSGLLTYSKKDEEYDNTFLVLTVLVSPRSMSETDLSLRGFIYSNSYSGMQSINVFPSDGKLEYDYLNIIRSNLFN